MPDGDNGPHEVGPLELNMTYGTAFTRTQKSKKESALKKDQGSNRNKRTWLVDYEVVVRRGMVHASQGRIS